MLVRDTRRLSLIVAPLVFLFLIGWRLVGRASDDAAFGSRVAGWPDGVDDQAKGGQQPVGPEPAAGSAGEAVPKAPTGPSSHRELFALSTPDNKYFPIDFGGQEAINPNILPHPALDDTYIIIAQQQPSLTTFGEGLCSAVFRDGKLACTSPPTLLPIAPSKTDRCTGKYDVLNLNEGPHDARVFHGPKAPFVLYGSNSAFTCFGQWLQDFGVLFDWGQEKPTAGDFLQGTEVQRPPPYGEVEKNWFLFWDSQERPYVHYDLAPKRVFSRIAADGTAGPDLAPVAAEHDGRCLARYLPKLASEHESIHQSSNTLSVTMCKRSDRSCTPDDSNTFLFTVYNYKTYYDYHSVYEPYVMMFKRTEPFEIHAMSEKPMWIHGRERVPDQNRTQMFYIVSMSWKAKGQGYHGFLDDPLLVSFGVEDKTMAGIDVVAADLLAGLGLCDP